MLEENVLLMYYIDCKQNILLIFASLVHKKNGNRCFDFSFEGLGRVNENNLCHFEIF